MDEQAKHECPNCRRLEKRVAELERQVAQLTALLEESRRAGKRQAAPFRKPPKAKPKKPACRCRQIDEKSLKETLDLLGEFAKKLNLDKVVDGGQQGA